MKILYSLIIFQIKRFIFWGGPVFWSLISNLIIFSIQISLWEKTLLLSNNFLITYFGLCLFLKPLISVKTDRYLQESFNNSSILFDTLKPISFSKLILLKDIANSVYTFLFVSLPSVIIIQLIYNLNFNINIGNFLFFIMSAIISFLTAWIIAFLTGLTVFYFKNCEGFIQLRLFTIPLLSGAIIPLDVFPISFKKIILILPFSGLIDSPIKILLSSQNNLIFQLLFFQLSWLFLLMIILHIFKNKAINNLDVMGG